MSTVEYLPGGQSAAHRHDANVMVYVLEGSLTMEEYYQPPEKRRFRQRTE